MLFRGLVLGHLRNNRLRALVTLVAVGLGVAISLAIDLANATAVSSFASSVNVVANHVNLQVLGVGRGFDERALLRVQALDGVRYAAPTIEESVVVGARPGDPFSGEILRVLGVDLLRPLPRDDGAQTATPGEFSVGGGPNPATLVDGRGAIVSERIASRYHLHVGSLLTSLSGDRVVRFRVAGILPAGIAGLDTSVMFVDIATAQDVFGKIGLLDRIDLIVDDARVSAVQKAVAAVIPHGSRAIRPEVRTGEIKRMLRSFQLNLAALSYIAMLVGMYLIYNTVAISVVQRRPDVGTLRALGATRRQIFVAFLGEGALFGTFGSLLGLVLGALLARLSVGAVSRTVDALYVATHADRVVYDPLVLLKAFVVGFVLATLSAVFPAIEASSTAPAITMRSLGFEARRVRPGVGLALCGAGLLFVAYLLTFPPPFDGIPIAGYAAGLAIIFGASLCVPLAIAGVASAARRFGARFSPSARIGAANLGASLRRNSVAVASLMVAIAMMVSVAILIGSFPDDRRRVGGRNAQGRSVRAAARLAGRIVRRALFARRRDEDPRDPGRRRGRHVPRDLDPVPRNADDARRRRLSHDRRPQQTALHRQRRHAPSRAHDAGYGRRRDQRAVRHAIRHAYRRRRRRRYAERAHALSRGRALQRLLDGFGDRARG